MFPPESGKETMTPTLYFGSNDSFSDSVTYDKNTKTFSIKASNLPDQDVTLINNYAFQAFHIYSIKSGVRKLFTSSLTYRDAAGRVQFWSYTEPSGFKLHVLND